MTGYDFGQTVLVQFPFTDQIGLKRRPAVVVSSSAYHRRRPDLILLAITSQLGEIPISSTCWFPTGGRRGS